MHQDIPNLLYIVGIVIAVIVFIYWRARVES